MTDEEISKAFCSRLKQEGLQKDIHYVAFTNRHWEIYKQIRAAFCDEHNLSLYDHMRAIQAGVHMYLAESD